MLKRAGIGAGALALPAAFGTQAAFAFPPNGHRMYAAVAFSQGSTGGGVTNPRMVLNICGTFKPDAGWIKGGGSWMLLDWSPPALARLVASGLWQPRELVNYQTNFGPPTNPAGIVGTFQASIVDMLADFEGLANDVATKLICNVGPAGIQTGQPEGWKATIPPYGEFVPIGIGITHTSVEGISV